MKNSIIAAISFLLFLLMITFIQPSLFPYGTIQLNTGTPGNAGITTVLFNTYILPFEIVTFLLVAAMLGAMYLGERGEKK